MHVISMHVLPFHVLVDELIPMKRDNVRETLTIYRSNESIKNQRKNS